MTAGNFDKFMQGGVGSTKAHNVSLLVIGCEEGEKGHDQVKAEKPYFIGLPAQIFNIL